jgi:hypothetical protein
MSLTHFPDPDMPDYRDIRLRDDARTVPPSIVQAYQLDGANITALETGSYNVHFKIEHEDQAYDVRKSNRPNNAGNLEYEAEVLNHLEKNGFALAPKIVPEASGKPNLWIDDTGGHYSDGWGMVRLPESLWSILLEFIMPR